MRVEMHGPPPARVAFHLGRLWAHVRPTGPEDAAEAEDAVAEILRAVGTPEEEVQQAVLFLRVGGPLKT